MKKNAIIWSAIALGLVGIIVVASVLYNNLSAEHKANNVIVFSAPQETAESDETSDEVTTSEEDASSEEASSEKQSSKEKNSSNNKTSSDGKNSSEKTSKPQKSNNKDKNSSNGKNNSTNKTGNQTKVSSNYKDNNVKTSSVDKTGDSVKPNNNQNTNNVNNVGDSAKPNNNAVTSSEVSTSSEDTVVDDEVIDDATQEETSDKVYFYDFTVVDANGNEVKLSDFRGKPIVLNFWTSWCGYCKREMPDFEKAAKAYPDVNFVMVNATCDKKETITKAKKYIEESGLDLNFYFDVNKEAVEEYGIRSYPSTYFLDAKGNMISYSAGSLDYDGLVENIELAIEGY